MPIKRDSLTIVCGVVVAIVVGCEKDEIRRYRVPRLETPEPRAAGQSDRPAQRMLAAIFPHGDRTWFFKLVGPVERVGEHEESFDRFVRSVHVTTDSRIAWTVPEGWREQPGSGMRYATFHLGPTDPPLELTVIPLEGERASVLANVNRWRGQIGLDPISNTELSEVTAELKLDGITATLVDMKTPVQPSGRQNLPAASSRPPSTRGATPRPLSYTTPAGWKEQPDPSGMRVAGFQVKDGDKQAEVTVVPLPGPAGGLAQNVNRWRGQVGLSPASDEQLRREIGQIEVAGTAAPYVDLVGPESAARERPRILSVLVVRDDQTWFFKMTGPADLVEKQKTAFEEFVRSVRFETGGTP